MKTITILIPAYNEEAVLPKLIARLDDMANSLKKYTVSYLFINDGSRDKTLTMLQGLADSNPRVTYISLSRNFGKEAAMLAGFDYASGDAVVIIDADLQDPPQLIPDMIRLWEEGYDDVYAKRRSRDGESWLKKKTSEWFYGLLAHSTSIPIQRDTGDFRLLDKRAVVALREFRETDRYTKGMFSWIGFKKKEILYDRDPRAAGTTKWSYSKLIGLAIDGITTFTTLPLRIASYMGIFVSFIALIYIIYIVVRTMLFGSDLAGYPSTMAVILFLGGAQLLSLGVIGEYVARIFNESKKRPVYLIDEARGISDPHEKRH